MEYPRIFARKRLWWGPAVALCLAAGFTGRGPAVRGDDRQAIAVSPEAAEFFETRIRPVLAANCTSCHGPDAQMAGLRLDTKAGFLKGGDGGPIVVPGDAAKSPLIAVLAHDGKIKMPPSGKLKADEIAAITAWVGMGAPWPEAPLSEAAVKEAATGAYAITEGQRKFWSFRPVRTPPLPPVKDRSWAAGSAIDRFILARLEKEGLKPAPPADRRTLIRRATFDLHGLPPTPAEVDAFLADRSPDAWAKVVDRLLASPRYGERWARHWLDVARYADTKGYVFEEDRRYPHAYNYRDWVVRAFNEDLPYDRFVTEQLAADRLPLGDDKRPLAALGFLTVGRRFLNNPHDIIDDRIDVVTRGFLGLTVSCARCHNHKFDPIPTADYYSLYGVFASSVEPAPQIIAPKAVADPWRAHDAKVQAAVSEEQELVMAQVKRLRERLAKGETLPDPVKDGLQNTREEMRPRDNVLPTLEAAFEAGVPDRLKTLRDSLASLRKTYPPAPERAMTLEDAPQPMTPRIFRRGNPGNPGDEVPRRFLQVLASNGGERPEWKNGSGRLELARAIASKNNPLTARVFVNRVWMQHFGAALVRTPSDFGLQGERPTHPDLLDHLAATFMESGWRVKNLHRRILLSNTYRQSSNTSEKSFRRDPENRLVGRMNRRRLEYEALRDSLLWASGRLDTNKIGGPAEDLWKAPFPTRRTLYGFIDRQNLPGVFRTFDFASPDASSPQRFRTTVPQQALFLLNSPFAAEQARFLARRPEVAKKPDDAARVRTLYRLLFHRAPDADEMAVALRFVKSASGASAGAATDVAAADPWRHGYGAFDAATGRVTGFTPLPFWNGERWQASAAFPDPKLHFVTLTATGGHPGADAKHAAIRRWTAPRDGVVSVRGTIGHGHVGDGGDGVEARIVSSRAGSLGVWVAERAKVATVLDNVAVRKGETLDFVASPRANHNFDSFTWAPVITLAGDAKAVWDAGAQFSGPGQPAGTALTAWERYAQALLMTNEFTFVD
jgi:mono/diheme cytochrome c family protein